MWIILVPHEERKVPLLAKAGPGLYLLAFKSGHAAQKFLAEKRVANGEPRLVMRRNAGEVLSHLGREKVAGMLVDYDAMSNTYREAGLVY